MKVKFLIVAFAALLISATKSSAQVKIGYTNIELILAYMPETEQVNKDLQVYAKKLQAALKVEEDYYQLKTNEYMELSKANKLTAQDQAVRESELIKLDSALNRKQQMQEQSLQQMQQELIQPLLEKLQKGIDEIAKQEGYTYVLNQTSGGGVSTILFGPDSDDLTEKIMTHLGIKIPENLKQQEKEGAPPKENTQQKP